MEFDRIFTGVAVRTSGIHGHTLIDGPTLLVPERAEHQFSVRRFPKRHAALAGKNTAGDLGAAVAGQS